MIDANALIAGKDGQITLQGPDTACISHITLTNADGSSAPITFAPVASEPSAVSLKIPLQGRQPGRYSLELQQYGIAIPRVLPVTVYSGDTQLDKVLISLTGDTATIFGKSLENVLSMKVGDQVFSPRPRLETSAASTSIRLALHSLRTLRAPSLLSRMVG